MTVSDIASHLPEDVRDGLRHMAALLGPTQPFRGMLAEVTRAEVDAAIRWIYDLSTCDLPPEPRASA